MKRQLLVKSIEDGHVCHTLDVTGKSERQIERIMSGMLINMDTSRWFIDDEETTAASASPLPAVPSQR